MSTDFGRDISCTDSIRTGRYATGVQLVAEALYRRFTTPRGMLRGGVEEASYGLDLTSFVGSTTTAKDAASLGGRIRSEAMKEERVTTANVTVVVTKTGPAVSFAIAIDVTTAAGPFTLKLGVSAVSVELLGITTEAP